MMLDANEKPLVSVFECWDDNEANIVVSVLRDGGIVSQANSEVSHDVIPVVTGRLGKVEVLVAEEHADEARRVIEEHKRLSEAASEPVDRE